MSSTPWSGSSHPNQGCTVVSGMVRASHSTRPTRFCRTLIPFSRVCALNAYYKICNHRGIYVCLCSHDNTICHHYTHHIGWYVSAALICTMLIYIHRRTGPVHPLRPEGHGERQDLRPESECRLVQSLRTNRQVRPRD